jgi:hypothetical protein
VIDAFRRHGVPGTAIINATVCDHHPEILHAAKELGWDFMAHGWTNAIRLNEMDPGLERASIADVFARIEREIGRAPRGWLSPGMEETWNTLDYLAEHDCRYICDWNNDDQPYYLAAGEGRMVSLPYAWDLNDNPQILTLGRSLEEFEGMIRRTFEVLLREAKESGSGRVMCLALHPYIIGVPHRIDLLNRVLADICCHQDVWCATADQIVDHCLQTGAIF